MATLRAYLASLGAAGAVANVRRALDQRARDERAVAALEARMGDARPAEAPPARVAA